MNIDTGLVDAYQAGIERTWGLSPQRAAPDAPNTKDAWSFTNIEVRVRRSAITRAWTQVVPQRPSHSTKDDSAPRCGRERRKGICLTWIPCMRFPRFHSRAPAIQGHTTSHARKICIRFSESTTAVRASALLPTLKTLSPGYSIVDGWNHQSPASPHRAGE